MSKIDEYRRINLNDFADLEFYAGITETNAISISLILAFRQKPYIESLCSVTIRRIRSGESLVICSEIKENTGRSIDNGVERLIEELASLVDLKRAVVIFRYDQESYNYWPEGEKPRNTKLHIEKKNTTGHYTVQFERGVEEESLQQMIDEIVERGAPADVEILSIII